MVTKYRSQVSYKTRRSRTVFVQGYTRFQLKLGGCPDMDILRILACREVMAEGEVLVGDSNTGWSQHQALRVAAAVRGVDWYMEQPCPSYRECAVVRSHTDLPFVLDEVVDSVHSLLEVARDGTADVVNIKVPYLLFSSIARCSVQISKFGGLTRARQAVELCSSLGLAMTIGRPAGRPL